MLTQLPEELRQTERGQTADRILRACVHCGFCLATCPTYRELGNELDSPRGRIYLIKALLEGEAVTEQTQLHLDRCLTCRACETTCPSGVQYSRLLEIGREQMETQQPRPAIQRWQRKMLKWILPYRRRFNLLLRSGQWLRPLLPTRLKQKIPLSRGAGHWPTTQHTRRVLLFTGCVQPGLAPNINSALARLLDRLQISVTQITNEQCCGALDLHLSDVGQARVFARRNIDLWWPHIEAGAEAILVSASGCGVMVKDYGELLASDPDYAKRADRVAMLAQDPAEYLANKSVESLGTVSGQIAFQSPCTLQHGQQLAGVTENLLKRFGLDLLPVADAHQCCGSAGTYSILQPALADKIREKKLVCLQAGSPEYIATANIGCLLHLQQGTDLPVRHWLEIVDAGLD
ncbi:MAG: glycolate oxidase subunit GlcF [Gammaproteobacteria bacterium]